MLIGEKEVELKLTGDVLLIFKETFKKDFFKSSSNFIRDGELTEAIDMIYAFAKADNPGFMSYKVFMKELGNTIPLGDLIGIEGQTELIDALNNGLSGTKEIKKKETENQTNN